MMENDTQEVDLEKDTTEPDLEQVQDEQLKKTLQTEIARKKHWREKYERATQELEKVKQAVPVSPPVTPATPPDNERIARLEEAEERRQFGHKHGYTPDETDVIFAQAKGFGKKPEEVLEHPFVKGGLESLRAQARVANATPKSASGGGVRVGGKDFASMSKAERRAAWPEITKNLPETR